MKKGGYQIIDLSAYKFTNGEPQIIKNVFNIIKNTKKVVLISGLTVDDTEYHDMFTVFMDYETFFCGLSQYEGNNICFVVENDGSVVVNVSEVNKEPVAYLYNGQRLPALPDFDVESYPYCFISKWVVTGTYLTCCNRKPVVYSGSGSNTYLHSNSGVITALIFKYINNIWERQADIEITEESSRTAPFWANFDVTYGDGKAYLSASEPVPVYE